MVLDLAMLNTLFKPKNELSLRPETQSNVLFQQVNLLAEKTVKRRQGLDVAHILDPETYLKNLHTEDVAKMVNYYLENVDCLDID